MAAELTPVKIVSVAAVAATLVLSGCSGHKADEGAATPTSATAASTTANPPAPGGPAAETNLPEGFPKDIPILKGTVTGKSFDVPGTTGKMWTLRVADVGADGFQQAQQLLTDAGFKIDKEAGAEPGCDLQGALSKDRPEDGGGYTIVLCSQAIDKSTRLTYSVNVYPQSDWGTNLKPPSDVPVFPTAPK